MHFAGHLALWALPSQRLKVKVPLDVRSVGRNEVAAGWQEKPKRKWFAQLFWTVEGQADFRVGKKCYRVKPGDVFIYRPGETHIIRAVTGKWICCWITWDHPESMRWVEAFHLKHHLNHRTPCPQWLFREVAEGLSENIPQGQKRAIQAAHAILLEASLNRRHDPHSHPAAERARAHLDSNFRDSSLTMESLSEILGVHRTTLFRSFQSSYGTSPSVYLHNRRMENALAQLHRSGLRISEVADRSGFSDPNYFSRAVKAATGMTPREIQLSAGS